ncbi:MAG: zinc transporter, family [Bacteroidales bacterium]|jgi:ZIP family zinc transporter|nr:zinc transporter, family [Bacteroidales bacterium]MDN5330574.1 zinc transporter, family [Bacteroidales bacterium]
MEYTVKELLFALGLTLFAGLSTGIGSAIAFFAKRTNTRFLSISLGFSAGVMIYVSFVELFFKARTSLEELGADGNISHTMAYWLAVLSFFGGILIIALIDRLIPNVENPHEMKTVEMINQGNKNPALMRMGLFTALVIGIHNFPEGIATFVSALSDLRLGIPIAIAIAIHNIPEGIAVSVPIYFATGSKRKAFWYSFSSGLAEPVGALTAYLFLAPFLNQYPAINGVIFAAIAGIMVFISIDELLPAAEEYGEHHLAIYGLIAGMVLMALSLLMFE